MVLVRPPALARLLWPGLLWRMPAEERALYLTFDDGPEPTVTPWVLDELRARDAKATFFIVGANAERHPELVRRIRSEGHAIGNHTHRHLNGWRTATGEYRDEVDRAQALTGTRLFRPPYGRITRAQADMLKARFTVVMWDVLSKDYDARCSPDECARNVLRAARPGSIIVFHDSRRAEASLRHALPLALNEWKRLGYAFRALPEEGLTAAPR